MSKKHKLEVEEEQILEKIHWIRGHKVMLDQDLALLYGIPTKRLNEQVNRNRMRFPEDFMFQVTPNELQILKSQFATSSWGGRRKLPNVFTEHGVLMLSSVLNSPAAIAMNIRIMRVYVKFRSILSAHKELLNKLEKLEHSLMLQGERHEKHEMDILVLFDAIKQIINPPNKPRKPIGY